MEWFFAFFRFLIGLEVRTFSFSFLRKGYFFNFLTSIYIILYSINFLYVFYHDSTGLTKRAKKSTFIVSFHYKTFPEEVLKHWAACRQIVGRDLKA